MRERGKNSLFFLLFEQQQQLLMKNAKKNERVRVRVLRKRRLMQS